MILLQNEAYRTVTVSIVSMTNKFGSNPPLLYAGLLLSALRSSRASARAR